MEVWSFGISPNGSEIAIGASHGVVDIVSLNSNDGKSRNFQAYSKSENILKQVNVTGIMYSPDGEYLLTIGSPIDQNLSAKEKPIKIWNSVDLTLAYSFDIDDGAFIVSSSWSSDSKRIGIIYGIYSYKIIDLTGIRKEFSRNFSSEIASIKFSNHDGRYALGGRNVVYFCSQ